MKKLYLYHGSAHKIKGKKLLPKRPGDLENNPENLIRGVYATDIKELAMGMALISCKGVLASGINFEKGKTKGIVYDGWPNQKSFFLYTLSPEGFKQSRGIKNQFVSRDPVVIKGEEELKVSDYIRLIRKANKKEIGRFKKKYPDVKL